ncbi:hypothetical protein DPV78_011803 [Talaromyces pinophilus]|nr:hypothetical protein DPV78_011803 [Talaromyces pinophilus]
MAHGTFTFVPELVYSWYLASTAIRPGHCIIYKPLPFAVLYWDNYPDPAVLGNRTYHTL